MADATTTTVGFLHTSPVHVPTFDRLLAERAPGWRAVHLVDEALLADARARGTDDPDVRRSLASSVERLRGDGADVVLCTCSTVGGPAEGLADAGRPVVRVDRAMADVAVASGAPIAVIVAIESAAAPAVEVLADAAGRAGTDPAVEVVRCFAAWTRFEDGDLAGYHAALASAIDALPAGLATVVLAQASMAGAAPLVRSRRTILSSPEQAVAALVRALGAPRPAP